MRRHRYLHIALALTLAATLGACEESSVRTEAQAAPTVIEISGSSACEPMVRLLTDTSDLPDVEWHYISSPGSRSGIEGVAAGELEIGEVSRLLRPDEEALGLIYTQLSDDGIVFALHPSVGVSELTTQQVRDIYAGAITNWQELGGPDLPIVVLDRHESESAKAIMREHVFGELAIGSRVASLLTESDMVRGVEQTVGAIGYFSLGYGVSRDIEVTYPSLDGVSPSVQTIRDGSYRIVRPLGLVTASDAEPTVLALLEWATSQTAADLLESNGYAAVQ
ncbi:hypothetical protein EG835_02385 [bacterium]|nr:hypothetical protein [bacterium]